MDKPFSRGRSSSDNRGQLSKFFLGSQLCIKYSQLQLPVTNRQISVARCAEAIAHRRLTGWLGSRRAKRGARDDGWVPKRDASAQSLPSNPASLISSAARGVAFQSLVRNRQPGTAVQYAAANDRKTRQNNSYVPHMLGKRVVFIVHRAALAHTCYLTSQLGTDGSGNPRTS